MGTMYLPMERSKHSIIVSEPTLLGTKNRKQTKVVFFFLCTSWWCYTVFHPVQLKQPYPECGCILCFFLFRSGLFVIHLFIIYVFCQ